jgi:hypothetical protein
VLGEGLVADPGDAVCTRHPAGSWLTAQPRTALLATAAVALALATGALGATHAKFGVAMVLAAAVVMVVLLWPLVGGLVLAGVVPVISGLATGVPLPAVRASEALVGLIGVTLLVAARRGDAVPWGVLDWLSLVYGVAWAVTGAFDAVALREHLTMSEWGTVLGQMQFFLIYRGVRVSVRTARERRIALGAILAASVPVAALAVLQEAGAPGVRSFLFAITGSAEATVAAPGTVAPLSISDLHRATGPFANWTSLAGYLFPVLLLMCALALAGQVGRRRRWFAAVAGLAGAGLLVSDEQSAIIGLAVGVIVLGASYARTRQVLRWLLLAGVVGAVVFGPTIGRRIATELAPSARSSSSSFVPQTLSYRGEVWSGQYFPAIGQRPLTGYGVVTPPTIQWPYTESEYVTVLMEGGVPLLLVFGATTWAMIRRSRRLARGADPLGRALGRALTVSVATLVVMDVIWPYMSNGGLPQVLWALLALAEVGVLTTVPGRSPTRPDLADVAAAGAGPLAPAP